MKPLPAVVLTVTLAGAILAPPAAAAPWSAPVDSGPPSNGVRLIGLDVSPRGTDAVGWIRHQTSIVSRARSRRSPGAERRLAGTLAAGPKLDATGRGIVLTTRLVGDRAPGRERQRVGWARLTPSGRPGRVRMIRTVGGFAIGLALDVNARGEAIAAWTEELTPSRSGARQRYRTFASYRRRGGSFGRPRLIFSTPATADPNPISVAIGRDGRAVVVEANSKRVQARMRTRRSDFGSTRRFGFQHGSTRTAAAISRSGRTIVVWGTQDGGEQADRPWIVSAARLRKGAGRFFTQTLDHGGAVGRPQGRIAVAIAPDGRATAAWSAIAVGPGRNSLFPVMTARSDRGGFFAPKRAIAASGAVGDVAVRADGATAIVWARALGPQQTDQAQAALRAARSSTFGPSEEIAAPDMADPPLVAFNPRSGQPIAAWAARPTGIDPSSPAGVRTSILRLATRVAP